MRANFQLCARMGPHFPAFFTFSILIDINSEMKGFVGVSTDITERLRAEEKLHNKDILLGGVAVATNILITDTDLNQALNQTLGAFGNSHGRRSNLYFRESTFEDRRIPCKHAL